jgi:nickel-type superoxide dismutase maturation protease
MLIAKLTWQIRWRFPQMVLVEGPSMEPGLPDGSWVVMLPTPGRLPRLGQVVVAEHPHRPGFELVKRVGAVSRSRRLLWLAGDNRAESTDSDDFGPVTAAGLVGIVVLRLRPWPPQWQRADPERLR